MKISIVVPVFNEEQFLGKTLAQIKAAAGALANIGWETELIVCDNNSSDRTAEIARAAGANVVYEPVNQISRARNSGAAATIGDWLVFVDADSHPIAEVFADMAKEIQSGNCIAGGATNRISGFQADWVLSHLRKTARAFPRRNGGQIFLLSSAIAGVVHLCPSVTE